MKAGSSFVVVRATAALFLFFFFVLFVVPTCAAALDGFTRNQCGWQPNGKSCPSSVGVKTCEFRPFRGTNKEGRKREQRRVYIPFARVARTCTYWDFELRASSYNWNALRDRPTADLDRVFGCLLIAAFVTILSLKWQCDERIHRVEITPCTCDSSSSMTKLVLFAN